MSGVIKLMKDILSDCMILRIQTDIDDEIYTKTKSKIIDQITNSKLILFVVSAKDEINSIELKYLLIRKKTRK